MKIRFIAPCVLIGCLAPSALAGWQLTAMPPQITFGYMVNGGASCVVAARPAAITNTAKGKGSAATEYTVTCHGSADMEWFWRYTGTPEAPLGWASVEAIAKVDGQFFVEETPMSFAHDTVVEVRSELLPRRRVRAEINDSRMFDDKATTIGGGAQVVGTGGTISTTVNFSGIPQMYFYLEVLESDGGSKCIDAFSVRWHTEGDAFLWVDDGWFYPGAGDYTLQGGSTTTVVTAVCPDCGGGQGQH